MTSLSQKILPNEGSSLALALVALPAFSSLPEPSLQENLLQEPAPQRTTLQKAGSLKVFQPAESINSHRDTQLLASSNLEKVEPLRELTFSFPITENFSFDSLKKSVQSENGAESTPLEDSQDSQEQAPSSIISARPSSLLALSTALKNLSDLSLPTMLFAALHLKNRTRGLGALCGGMAAAAVAGAVAGSLLLSSTPPIIPLKFAAKALLITAGVLMMKNAALSRNDPADPKQNWLRKTVDTFGLSKFVDRKNILQIDKSWHLFALGLTTEVVDGSAMMIGGFSASGAGLLSSASYGAIGMASSCAFVFGVSALLSKVAPKRAELVGIKEIHTSEESQEFSSKALRSSRVAQFACGASLSAYSLLTVL